LKNRLKKDGGKRFFESILCWSSIKNFISITDLGKNMQLLFRFSSLFFALFVSFNVYAVSAPNLINYQGKLSDDKGDFFGYPATKTTANLTFKLYTVVSGGVPIWSQTFVNTPVINGHFNVILGAGIGDGLLAGADTYLEITVGAAAAIAPRQKLLSTPYSQVSQQAHLADNFSAGEMSGAVMAFNRSSCPAGWLPFVAASARVIVGTGSQAGLSNRTLLMTGGAETVVLTVAQLASHSHAGKNKPGAFGSTGNNMVGIGSSVGTVYPAQVGATGGNQPHENMPPFVALLYCEKS